jgi:hypothetical protein
MAEWQSIVDREGDHTERLEVPGGWLYRTMIVPYAESAAPSIALAFVPQPLTTLMRSVADAYATPAAMTPEEPTPAEREDEERERLNMVAANAVKREHNFVSVWSIPGVDFFDAPHIYDATHMYYDAHWGENQTGIVKIPGKKWLDLWRAAEELIRASGDEHHVFIEDFVSSVDADGTKVLSLQTGS